MADTGGGAKYTTINANANANGTTLLTEMKTEFGHHLFNTKKTTFAYGFMFTFFALTFFYVSFFTPPSSSNSISSSLSWFNKPTTTTHKFKSHFPPPFLANSNSNSTNHESSTSVGVGVGVGGQPHLPKTSQIINNATQNAELQDKVGVLNPDQTLISPPNTTNSFSGDVKNQTTSKDFDHKDEILKPNPPPNPFLVVKNATTTAEKSLSVESAVKNVSSSLAKKQHQNNKTNSVVYTQQQLERENLVKSLVYCDIFNGNWVRDESYPLYNPGSCSLIDEQFNCFLNGRPDTNYERLRWKPKGCSLPRLDGRHMLDLLRGKRLVFVGDSLNRNMWESLVCILRNSVKDKKKVYEASGNVHFKTEASYSFVFEDYKFTVEFFATPFLVQEWEMKGKNGEKKETLRLDMLGESANNYKSADIIIFNTGHWWTHEKTSLGKDYYQEGSHVYEELNVVEAFRKALTTWGRWVDANINPQKSVVFFRGYSASHFSGGQWNSGGACDHEIEPIKNETYLSEYPTKMKVLERVLKGMKTQVSYMNITRMTDYRKDGHPSVYRKQTLSEEDKRSPLLYQDCSHWCLPGVPDVWNEILYAQLLLREYEKQTTTK